MNINLCDSHQKLEIMNASIVDVLIENIKTDQDLLQDVEVKIDEAKAEKLVIVNRLKELQKDIATFLKYADEKQQQKIQELGFDFSQSEKSINSVATIAFDLIIKAKDNELTNEALYEGYVKSLKNKEDAVKYSEFNIKCRTLFNTQKLLRKKGKDPKSSKQDIISLNGRQIKSAVEKQASKMPQNKKKDDTVSK